MKLKRTGDKLYFVRQQENEKFAKTVISMLLSDETISVREYIMGPSEDIYNCTIQGHEFHFVFDLDYGCWFQSGDIEALELLEGYFEAIFE